MKSFLRILSFTFLICISSRNICFTQENFSRYARYTYTENYLKDKGYDVQKNTVVPEYVGRFPSNVSVEIQAQNNPKPDSEQNTIDNVIFSFTQDFFVKDPEFIVSFIEETKKNKLPYGVTILLSTDDESTVLEADSQTSCGSDYFAERLYESDTTCAYVIFDRDYCPYQIKTFGAGTFSPMWIAKAVEKSFLSNQNPITIQRGLLYNNRRNLLKENRRLSAFMKKEITCVGFPLGHSQNDLNILSTLLNETTSSRKQGGSIIYNNLSIGTFSMWINESLLTIIYLGFSIIALITVCFSSFTFSARNEAIFKDLSRTWFIGPLYILLSSLFLTLFQTIFSPSINSPALYFILKTTTALSFLFVVSYIQKFYSFRMSITSISFQMLILCALNIFIFSFIDLSLMFVFIIEYMIVLLTRNTKRKTISLMLFPMMILPFLQPSINVYMNSDHENLGLFFKTSYIGNIIFSFMLAPFVFQWTRCLLIFNIKGNYKESKRINGILYGTALSFIAAILIISFFSSFTLSASNFLSRDKKPSYISVEEADAKIITVQYSNTDNFDLISHRITVSCPEDKEILRSIVTLKGLSTPLYECNFNFNMISMDEAVIEIPDGSESQIVIFFSSDYGNEIQATMDFYILTDESHSVHETREVLLSGKLTNDKTI